MTRERENRWIVYVTDETHRELKMISAASGLKISAVADAVIRYVLRDRELLRRIIEDLGGKQPYR